MKYDYGERWGSFKVTADKLGETEDSHIVEVSVHDRETEMNVRLLVRKNDRYFGTMIGWVAARVVMADLVASDYERTRRLNSGRMMGEVFPVDREEYLQAFRQAPGLEMQALRLPDLAVRGHMMFAPIDVGTSYAGLHDSRKMIFDFGLPASVEFYRDPKGELKMVGHWPNYDIIFNGFDYRTPEGRSVLGDFLEMLNLWHPVDVAAMKPPRRPKREGPKDWSPPEGEAILTEGVDYGVWEVPDPSPRLSGWEPGPKDWSPPGAKLTPANVKRVLTVWLDSQGLLARWSNTKVLTNEEMKGLRTKREDYDPKALVSIVLDQPFFGIMNYNTNPELAREFETFLNNMTLVYDMGDPYILHVYPRPGHWKKSR